MTTRGGIRTGVAVMAALVAASDLIAQRPATTRTRDSIVVRVFGPGLLADSLRLLVQEFEREQAGTQKGLVLRGRIDSLVGIPEALVRANAFVRGMLAGAEAGPATLDVRRGWLGLSTQGPSRQAHLLNGDVLVTHLAYPTIVSVDPQSPADKAGILAGDDLIAYNGIDVVNHEFSMNALLRPETKVNVTVRRDGETKDYQLTVAKAPMRIAVRRRDFETMVQPSGGVRVGGFDLPEPGQRGRVVALPPEDRLMTGQTIGGTPILMISGNGVLGASVSTVNAELARALNLRAGVLVNEVPEDSPAFRAGLRIGDVITVVQDRPVVSVSELREMLVRAHARAVALQVARNQKTRTLTVSLSPTPSP